jgi:hypothetical protein
MAFSVRWSFTLLRGLVLDLISLSEVREDGIPIGLLKMRAGATFKFDGFTYIGSGFTALA